MARKTIYLIAANFQDKYIIRFVVCSCVTESRDITFAWEEIRSQANEVFSDNADYEEETPLQKEQNGVAKDASLFTKEIGLTINGNSDDETEIHVHISRNQEAQTYLYSPFLFSSIMQPLITLIHI
jgi:hypothetical protein